MEWWKWQKEYGEVKKMKIDEGDSLNQIIYIKNKEEENMKKALVCNENV